MSYFARNVHLKTAMAVGVHEMLLASHCIERLAHCSHGHQVLQLCKSAPWLDADFPSHSGSNTPTSASKCLDVVHATHGTSSNLAPFGDYLLSPHFQAACQLHWKVQGPESMHVVIASVCLPGKPAGCLAAGVDHAGRHSRR